MKTTDNIFFCLLRRSLLGDYAKWGAGKDSAIGSQDSSEEARNGICQNSQEIKNNSKIASHDGQEIRNNSKIACFEDQELWSDGKSVWYKGREIGIDEWKEIYHQASYQGVLALMWDGVKDLPLDKGLKLTWALNVEKIERKYEHQREVLEELAQLFEENDLNMMVIKGHGLSLLYPEPKHRPCGDIDFYLYGEYAKGDKILEDTHNLTTDLNKHHHTVNYYKGVMLENHYDFLNIEAHLSNKIIEERLIQEVESNKGEPHILSNGARFYTPSPEFNALFLLRHAAAHFAAERIGVRHLVDWALFLNHNSNKVDWKRFYHFAKEMNMHRFLNSINTICIEQLGVDPSFLPEYTREPKLEKRVLEEILHPGFNTPMPKGRTPMVYIWKLRRWTSNIWKNKIVYREGLLNQFFVLWMSHIFKPTLKNER